MGTKLFIAVATGSSVGDTVLCRRVDFGFHIKTILLVLIGRHTIETVAQYGKPRESDHNGNRYVYPDVD